jgi:O-antigen ligase
MPSAKVNITQIGFHSHPPDHKLSSNIAMIWAIALLPLFMTVTTWDSDGILTLAGYNLRHYSIAVTACELVVVYITIRSYDWLLGFRALPSWSLGLIALWVALALFSAISAGPQSQLSIFMTLRYVLHGLFFACLISLAAASTPTIEEKWAKILTAGGIAYVIALIAFILLLPEPDVFPWVARLPSATNIRQIGYYMAILSMAPLSLLMFNRESKIWLWGLCFASLIAFTAWSGSRGAIAGIVIGSALTLTLGKRLPKPKRLVACIAFSFAGITLSAALPPPAEGFGLFRMVDASINQADASSRRIEVWKNTITEIRNKPLFGHGAGTFRTNMEPKYHIPINHPHQLALQYIYDWGIIGGSVALILLILLVFNIFRTVRSCSVMAGNMALAATFTTGTIALVDGPLFSPLSIVLTLLMVAPALAYSIAAGSDQRKIFKEQ